MNRTYKNAVTLSLGLFMLGTSLPLRTKVALGDELPIYKDASKSVDARVDDLLARLTLEEKIAILHGNSKFTSAGIPRLGIARRWMSDGPHGVREDVGPDDWKAAGHTDDFSTYLPTSIGVAASWNPEDAQAMGKVIGEEARKRGKDIMLGPGVNIQRTPLNGRTFEYMGEDPYLSGRMAIGYIHGVQSQDVAACVKHFAANNQETDRLKVNVEMDERTLREIYLPAFKAAVKEGGVLTVMGAYNKFRGTFCSQNDYLLNKVLKGEWGFKGMVISDWGATHNTDEAVRGGLDLEMGTNNKESYDDYFLAKPFLDGIRAGEYPMSLLDDKVRRNLFVMISTNVLDSRPVGSLNTKEHQMVARRINEDSIVLLKNENAALPLDAKAIHSIAVIGENAQRKLAYGGESSAIKAFYEVPPLEGIVNRVGQTVNVTFSQGYRQDAPAGDSKDLIERAVAAAKAADVAVIVAGLNHKEGFDSEGADRKDMKLPFNQDELIRRVHEANPKTIVVLVSGSPIEMDGWIDQIPAVVQGWYGGMEGGNAVARVLFGDVNPSGKLPCTFPKKLEDTPAAVMGDYPGVNGTVTYKEGLLVGYRYYDTKNVEPLFPFGHGLSYTKFTYGNLKFTDAATPDDIVTVQCDVTNSGDRDGAEVVQLYIHQQNPALMRPTKELKSFRKVLLKAGETKSVTMSLPRSAFAYFDPAKSGWVSEAGNYDVLLGSSSRDIRLKDTYALKQAGLEKD